MSPLISPALSPIPENKIQPFDLQDNPLNNDTTYDNTANKPNIGEWIVDFPENSHWNAESGSQMGSTALKERNSQNENIQASGESSYSCSPISIRDEEDYKRSLRISSPESGAQKLKYSQHNLDNLISEGRIPGQSAYSDEFNRLTPSKFLHIPSKNNSVSNQSMSIDNGQVNSDITTRLPMEKRDKSVPSCGDIAELRKFSHKHAEKKRRDTMKYYFELIWKLMTSDNGLNCVESGHVVGASCIPPNIVENFEGSKKDLLKFQDKYPSKLQILEEAYLYVKSAQNENMNLHREIEHLKAQK